MADFGVKVAAAVEVDKGQFLSQLQAIAEGVTVKVGVEMDEASRSKFLNSLKNIVPKTPVKVKVEPETAGRSSFAKQLSSVAGRVDVGKKMQVSKTGLTSVAKQVQSGLDRTKLTLKLNKIDADAPIKDIGKQIKAEVATVSVGDGVKLDGDALGVSGVDNVLAQTAEMTSKAVEGLGEAKSATASWKDQLKDLDRIMKSVTKSRDSATRGKSNVLTDSSNVAKTEAEYQRLADSIRKIRDAETPVENSVIAGLEREAAAYEVLISKMREAESAAKASSSASAQSASKELAAQRKLMDTLEARANKVYENALTSKNPMLTDAGDIAEFQVRYQSLANEIREVNRAMNEGGTVDSARIASIEKETAALNQLAVARKEAAKAAEASSSAAKKASVSEHAAQMAELDTYLKSVQKTFDSATSGKSGLVMDEANLDEIRAKYVALRNEVERLRNSTEVASREEISSLKERADGVQALINQKRELEKQTRKTAAAEADAPIRQVNTLRDQMTRFLQSNTRVLDTNLGSEISGMLSQLESGAAISTQKLNKMRDAFARVKVEARQAGVMGKTFSDSLMDAYQRFGGWSIITNSLGHAVMAVRDMITNVVNLDTAMTELKKVTDETDATYEQFFAGAADRAREFGATVTDTITATADFARLGYDIDQASALADAALVYKNVGDGIDNISDASDSIISTMMAFDDLEGRDPMRIVDAFNELGNNFAISSEGLGEALTRSASGLAAANNTFEESAALVTAMNSTVQDPQKVGTTLKTVSMYLRAAKVEAEEAGVETEGMANSVSKLREDVMALTNGKVDIMLDDSTFKSTYQIMEEISEVWDEMTDVDQAALLEMIGGKRNSDAVMSLIKNFDVAKAALQDALGSEGSALAENEKYLDSIAGRVQQFKASFEELSSAFIDSDFAKGVVSFGDTVLRGLTGIVENLGSIPSLIAAIVSSISMIRGLKGNDQGLLSLFTLTGEKGHEKLGMFGNSFSDISSAFKEMRASGAGIFESFRKATGPLAGASKYIEKYNSLLGSSNDLLEEHYQKTAEYSRSLAQYLRQAGPEGGSLSGYDAYLKKSGNSVKKLGVGAKAASVGMNALKSAMNGMLVGLVTFGITSLIEAIVELAQAEEKAREEAAASAAELTESNTKLDEYKNQILDLRSELDSGTLSSSEAVQKREQLLGIQESLIGMYGREAAGIDLVSGSVDYLVERLDALAERKWRAWESENTDSGAIQSVVDKFTDVEPSDIDGIYVNSLTGKYNIPVPSLSEIKKGISEMNLNEVPETFYSELQSEFDKAGLNFDVDSMMDGLLATDLDVGSVYELLDVYQKVADIVGNVGNKWFGNNASEYLGGSTADMETQINAIANSIAQDEETFNTHVEGMLSYNEQYQDVWGSALDAQQKYNEAYLNNDKEGMRAALGQMSRVKADFEKAGWDDEAVNTYMDNFFSEFEDETHDISVKLNMEAEIEDDKNLRESVLGEIEKIQGEDGIIDTAKLNEIKAQIDAKTANGAVGEDLSAQEQAYLRLKSTADGYGWTIEQLIALMGELGYVTVTSTEEGSEAYADMTQQTQDVLSGIQNARSVLASQEAGKSISIDDFTASGMEDYQSALERVNGTLQLNREKVKEITKAKAEEQIAINNTNKALAQEQYLENAKQIQEYKKELAGMEDANSEAAKTIQADIDALVSQNEGIESTCAQYDLLTAALEEATGAYQGWLDAQSGADYGDMADNAASAVDLVYNTLFDSGSEEYGQIGTIAYQAAVDLIIPDSVDGEDEEAVKKYIKSIQKYFTFDENWNIDGFNRKNFLADAESKGLIEGEGSDWKLKGEQSVAEFAEGMNMKKDLVQAALDELAAYGITFDFTDNTGDDFEDLADRAAEAAEKLRETDLGADLDFQIDVSGIETTEGKISALDNTIATMNELKGKVDVDASEVDYANSIIQYCVQQKQQLSQPEVMKVDTSMVDGEISNAISLLQQFQTKQNEIEQLQSINVDVTAQKSELDSIVSEIQAINPDVQAKLKLDPTSSATIQSSINTIDSSVLVKAEVDPSAIAGYVPPSPAAPTVVDVVYEPNESALPTSFGPYEATVNYTPDTSQLPTTFTALRRYVIYEAIGDVDGVAMNGTAHAGGTARASGTANAGGSHRRTGEAKLHGDWGTAKGGRSLVGELGREIVVNPISGRWYTVGDRGPEFVDIPKGAIVFNHLQTEQLLKNGYADGRATALASGTAMAYGTSEQFDPAYIARVFGRYVGSYINSVSGGYQKPPEDQTATYTIEVKADNKDLEENLKDTLDEISEEIDGIIGNLEHRIFLIEKNRGDVDEIVATYRKMQEQVHAYAEKYRAQGLDENSDYIQDLQKQWWEYQESIQEVIVDTYEKATSERENAITLTENWLENAFEARDFLAVQVYADDIITFYETMQKIIHEQAEYYRSQGYSDISDEVSELSDLWWDYEENIEEIKQQVVDHLIEMADTSSEAVDNIQEVLDTFKNAADEFAANGGFISVDAFQEIVKLGPQYMQYLEDENGLLQINEESINRVIAAKTEQLALESAMNYIERLRQALQKESIEDLNHLLYATTETTNATWGLVYANLAILDLTGSQYEAALHNINAIRALAQNAISGIGKVSGEAEENLSDMKDGLDDILRYVMDMLEDRVQRQIDALEDMKDSYAELIDLKKESMEATKEETDYQDEVADKVKEIAELQARINALSLDDSRDAQAQKIELEEQMAELQKELADTQADYASDRQEESLDKMQDAYEEQKDQEIEKLEQTISSEEKLYQMAIEYIESHWETLYDELISWNYEYGSALNKEITEAWNNCLAAAQKYGSYVNALDKIDADIDNMGSGDNSNNVVIGKPGEDFSPSNLEMVQAIVAQMKVLSGQWDAENKTDAQNDALHEKASALAARLAQYGVVVKFRGSDGSWWIERDELNPGNAGQLLYSRYHSGGIVGDSPTVKQNEVLALLEKGEAVLDKQKEKGLYRLIDFASDISEKLRASIGMVDLSGVVDRMRAGMNDVPTEAFAGVTNNVGAIHFGDVYIYGSDGDAVRQHIDVNRRFVNEVLDRLNIRK